SVLLISASSSYQAPYALSTATSVRVGNMLGARSAKGAALATRVAIFLTLVVALVLSAIFLIFRKKWAYIFNNDPDVVDETARILPWVALFQIFDGLGAVTGGVLRAIGKQDAGALLCLIGYYIIGLPLGLLLAFKAKVGLQGLWIGLTVALVFQGLGGLYICTIRADWDKEVRKTMIRLGQEQEEEPQDARSHNSATSSTVVP
ncbi:hypothetical protein FRC17_008467, partial [Serendipita sp. 399]